MLSLSEMLLPLLGVALVIGPIWLLFRKGINSHNAKSRIIAQISIFAGVFMLTMLVEASHFTTLAEEAAANAGSAEAMGFLAAALAVAASSLGAAWAVASAAPAAIGAISENGDNFGKAIIFVALGEGIAIYGLLISILIINKL